MTAHHETAELPAAFREDLVPLDAEIAALKALEQGLNETMRRLLDDELHQRVEKERLNAAEPEPKTLDFLHSGGASDWHKAHGEWERRAIERKAKVEEVTDAHDRALRTYQEFGEWIVRPAKERLAALKARRTEIISARVSVCDAAMKAAWKGGMLAKA